MACGAYYNEHDLKTAAWLRELITAGLIADGEVDTRSIADVQPGDVRGFAQCHFFAGIGGWSYALRLAGWADDRRVWTGSCPCQPFSMAGVSKGTDDSRHLWPAWFGLIRECGPATIFGEQVASKDGLYWLDLVYVDLEGQDYAIGACDLAAASVGAFHRRQRLYFVADAAGVRAQRLSAEGQVSISDDDWRGKTGDMADAAGARYATSRQRSESAWRLPIESEQFSVNGKLADTDGRQSSDRDVQRGGQHRQWAQDGMAVWENAEWIACRDGKSRPVEPGTFPLAHGVPARVGRLRGYGNAIVPQVAAEFIAAYMEITCS